MSAFIWVAVLVIIRHFFFHWEVGPSCCKLSSHFLCEYLMLSFSVHSPGIIAPSVWLRAGAGVMVNAWGAKGVEKLLLLVSWMHITNFNSLQPYVIISLSKHAAKYKPGCHLAGIQVFLHRKLYTLKEKHYLYMWICFWEELKMYFLLISF